MGTCPGPGGGPRYWGCPGGGPCIRGSIPAVQKCQNNSRLKGLSQTYPEGAFHPVEAPFVDRTLGWGEVHRWARIPGLVAALDAVGARRCVAAAEVPEVVWDHLALT